MRSLRLRLLLGAAVGIVVALTAAGIFMVRSSPRASSAIVKRPEDQLSAQLIAEVDPRRREPAASTELL